MLQTPHTPATYEAEAALTACTLLLRECLQNERPAVNMTDLAPRLGVQPARLAKWLDPLAGSNNFPAGLLPVWDAMVGPAALQGICHAAGYRPPVALDLHSSPLPPHRLAIEALSQLSVVLNLLLPHPDGAWPHQVRKSAHTALQGVIADLLTLDAHLNAPPAPRPQAAWLDRRAA